MKPTKCTSENAISQITIVEKISVKISFVPVSYNHEYSAQIAANMYVCNIMAPLFEVSEQK